MEVHWKDLEVGKRYQFEEKQYTQLVVKVITKVDDPDLYRYRIEVEESYGTDYVAPGKILLVSRSIGMYDSYLCHDLKFKTVGSMWDYVSFGQLEKWNGKEWKH